MSDLPPVLLDTDAISALMKHHPQATARAHVYLAKYQRLTFSVITRYEVLRGLLAKGATAQRNRFDRFCAASEVLPITETVIIRAAEIYADLHRRGALIGDADILIAATALTQGRLLVTNNELHMRRIIALQIDNWMTAE